MAVIFMSTLKDGLNLAIKYENWSKEKELSFFLRNTYSFQYAVVESCPCIFIFPIKILANISILKKHIVQIQKIENLPVVFVLKQISEFRRKAFIENKFPFIVDGKISYLPFIGTYMVHGQDQDEKLLTKFMPSAQLVFFCYLYSLQSELPLVKLSEKLPFSAMTMTRAVKQLVEGNLFQTYKDGVKVILKGANTCQPLYEQAMSFLKSPVKFTGYLERDELTEEFMLAGMSALAEYSMLNPEQCNTYAIKSGSIDQRKLQQEFIDEGKQVRIEVWRYDPHILGKNDIVDPLSLAVSLHEVSDERVEQAVDEMLIKIWEDKNGRWF